MTSAVTVPAGTATAKRAHDGPFPRSRGLGTAAVTALLVLTACGHPAGAQTLRPQPPAGPSRITLAEQKYNRDLSSWSHSPDVNTLRVRARGVLADILVVYRLDSSPAIATLVGIWRRECHIRSMRQAITVVHGLPSGVTT